MTCGATDIPHIQNSITMTQHHDTTAENRADDAIVDIHTTAGDIRVRLYGDTPRHRDNFIRLASEGFYDGVLFHRVINDFMIQTGDPDSKNAPKGAMLGSGDPDYQLDAEFVYPRHFHKRGALAAARQGDQVNPEKKSSGSQFYIVTGKTYNDAQLDHMDRQRAMMQQKAIFDRLVAEQRDTIMAMRRARDQAGLQTLQEKLIERTEAEAATLAPDTLTPRQREAYRTEGGTPHLDGAYTVFGEVISGMDVVDRIQKAETDANDRPVDDIRITSMEIVEPQRR
ncbi:peptidylprolyl isomerase [Paramuribaculum intestinale]|uniref:peptidylprolyl isomerase n=1 Tax=Paramuribaculum intestinale TaxID=2094151 RepID=UPI003F73FEEA